MRVAQLIDSLEAGGAERIVVNYANRLCDQIAYTALIVTRREGPLKPMIEPGVDYFFLGKKRTFDLNALLRLRKIVTTNKIDILHAHGPSFFTAFLLKCLYPKVKIVWHEHYGARALQSRKQNAVLYACAFAFELVLVVNRQLEAWAVQNLPAKKVAFIPNFAIFDSGQEPSTILKGLPGKKLVLVANLKKPKNHRLPLHSFERLQLAQAGWSLHFVGQDYQDGYSEELKQFIKANKLENSVFFYGGKNDIFHILSQAEVGILSSTEEGFPVTLLEYGLAGLAVLSTNAGFCPEIIQDGHSGLLFDPTDADAFEEQLQKMIASGDARKEFGLHLQQIVQQSFSPEQVISKLLGLYQIICDGK